jgi:hypothetical protein
VAADGGVRWWRRSAGWWSGSTSWYTSVLSGRGTHALLICLSPLVSLLDRFGKSGIRSGDLPLGLTSTVLVSDQYFTLACYDPELSGRFDWNSWEGLCIVDSACIVLVL